MVCIIYMYYTMYVPVVLPVMGSLSLIGFDTANVVRSTLHQFTYQLIGLSLWRESATK